jgi:Uma2 family endonuclease
MKKLAKVRPQLAILIVLWYLAYNSSSQRRRKAMSSIPSFNHQTINYPTSDGKPMAETEQHRDVMIDTITKLQLWLAGDPKMYVSGNLLMYYVPGDKRRHISPDVFVVRGVSKEQKRLYYLTWKEKKSPSMIIEITSKSTRKEDCKTKFVLYRDVLQVKEYFQFDPYGEYLKLQLQGYRLNKGDYVPIVPVNGRLPSKVVNLHLEADGVNLQLYDPVTQKWIPTPEKYQAARADTAETRADTAETRADTAETRADTAETRADQLDHVNKTLVEELERLREEMEKLRRPQ